jgi:glycosyltransferase involved in cell wall biosynthesis
MSLDLTRSNEMGQPSIRALRIGVIGSLDALNIAGLQQGKSGDRAELVVLPRHPRAARREALQQGIEIVVVSSPRGSAAALTYFGLGGWPLVIPARRAERGVSAFIRVVADPLVLPMGRVDDIGETVMRLAAKAGRPGAGLTGGPAVSVVVTVLNEVSVIDSLIADLEPQLRDDDEVVIVDGGSDDGTRERVAEWSRRCEAIKLIALPGTNISQGRNAGVSSAQNQIIAVTDAGCELAPEWLASLRMPFAEQDETGLVAGNPAVAADGLLERAQALACFPDADESCRPNPLVRYYGRLFGQTFDPTLPMGRSMAFSKEAWQDVGGFPEDLRWTEDGVFGRRIARRWPVRFAADARASWIQHATLRRTFHMYHQYGRGAAVSGERLLVIRDLVRFSAYVAGVTGLVRGGTWIRGTVLAGASLYFSLPLSRVWRRREGWPVALLIPFAMFTKDAGKVSGAARAWIDGHHPHRP